MDQTWRHAYTYLYENYKNEERYLSTASCLWTHFFSETSAIKANDSVKANITFHPVFVKPYIFRNFFQPAGRTRQQLILMKSRQTIYFLIRLL